MTLEELKLRQAAGLYLTEKGDKLTVVRDLCGMQAQFMTNVFHSLRLRCRDFDADTSGLVKNWTIRGTVHVFREDDLGLFIRHNYRERDWNGYTFWNRRDCWALTPARQGYFADLIIEAVAGRNYTRDELKELCRENGMTDEEESSMFDQWGGGIRELCERGFMNYTVEEKKNFTLSPDFTPVPDNEAKVEIARRYFRSYGPATIHDAMYFLGAKQSEVKAWLSCLDTKSAEYGGRTYYYIENNRSLTSPLPDCVFLAGFDPLMLGHEKKESLFLSQTHLRKIFNLAGIVMPPLLLHGNVVGRWKQKNGKLTAQLFEPISEKDTKTIRSAAEEMWQDLKKIEIT